MKSLEEEYQEIAEENELIAVEFLPMIVETWPDWKKEPNSPYSLRVEGEGGIIESYY